MEKIQDKMPRLSRGAFSRRAAEYLRRAQADLLPEHAQEFIAINMETGEYVLGKTPRETFLASNERWPHTLMYSCRVDGGPATKFYGM